MKKLLAFCLAMAVLSTLAACSIRSETGSTAATAATGSAPSAPKPPVSNSTDLSETHRLVKILRADFPIYDGPSYDNFPVGIVEAAGTYTIVEEVLDSEGNLWGKLKSGAGWVDLSLMERESHNMPPVTVAKVGNTTPNNGDYHYCQTDTSSYAYDISISAHETLSEVSLFSIDITENYTRGLAFFRISQLDPSKPLVASVHFPGVASLYGLEFTDQQGVTQIYIISESGRNGSVEILPFDGTLASTEPAPS